MIDFSKLSFDKSAVKVANAPPLQLPWIALAGRSNVGKSSLINALANRKKLARVAATPGKTALLNFYNVADQLFLVDLPGYGFAAVSKQEKTRWAAMMEAFFAQAVLLKAALLIVDARHEPSKDDVHMRDYLTTTGLDFVIVANKFDKLKPSEHAAARERIEAFAQGTPFLFFSAEKDIGRTELKHILHQMLTIEDENHA